MTDEQRARIDAYVQVMVDLNEYRFTDVGLDLTGFSIEAVWNLHQYCKRTFTVEEGMYFERQLTMLLAGREETQ